MEEQIGRGFKKSIPITVSAGVIWVLVALGYRDKGHSTALVTQAARHNLTEFVEVFLFLLCAMTFINTMQQLNVFHKLRYWLVDSGFSYRSCFWITGLIAFWLSIADNLTTAVLMGAVASSLGGNEREYVAMCCVNIVVAANAGGAFSPFGDLTTLMVWQKGKLDWTTSKLLVLPRQLARPGADDEPSHRGRRPSARGRGRRAIAPGRGGGDAPLRRHGGHDGLFPFVRRTCPPCSG